MEKLLEVALAKLPEAEKGEPLNPVIAVDAFGDETLFFLIDKGILGTKKYSFPKAELVKELDADENPPTKKKPAPKKVEKVVEKEVKIPVPKAPVKKAKK